VLADTKFLTSQNEGQNYLSVLNRDLDKFRASFDTTHSFAANSLFPILFGRGTKFGVNRGLDYMVGGWNVNGFTHWTSAPSTAVMCTAGQTTPWFDFAGAGHYGNMQYSGISGPNFFGRDFSIIKKIKPLEKLSIDLPHGPAECLRHDELHGASLNITAATFEQLILRGLVEFLRERGSGRYAGEF
jgi:hypothetical protein